MPKNILLLIQDGEITPGNDYWMVDEQYAELFEDADITVIRATFEGETWLFVPKTDENYGVLLGILGSDDLIIDFLEYFRSQEIGEVDLS